MIEVTVQDAYGDSITVDHGDPAVLDRVYITATEGASAVAFSYSGAQALELAAALEAAGRAAVAAEAMGL